MSIIRRGEGYLRRAPGYEHGGGFLLSRLGALADRQWGRFISDAGLTQVEFSILAVLADGKSLRQSQLARHAAVDARNVVASVARLAERGLVRTESDSHDRRAKQIRVTKAGTAAFASLQTSVAPLRGTFFEPLTHGEYTQLCHLLGRVYDRHLTRLQRD
jgi:DNA-binding MarR family transcriptional regulator